MPTNKNFHLQAEELRAYFKGLGAEISKERSEKGIEDDLHKIIGVCDACFTDVNNPNQIEEVLNGIVSMFALVRIEEKTKKKLTKQVLWIFFSLFYRLQVKNLKT